MGKKKNRQFANLISELATERGIRVGFLIITDGTVTSGYTTYNSVSDASEGMTVLKDMLVDLEERESE